MNIKVTKYYWSLIVDSDQWLARPNGTKVDQIDFNLRVNKERVYYLRPERVRSRNLCWRLPARHKTRLNF
jgi:hypothetical protein